MNWLCWSLFFVIVSGCKTTAPSSAVLDNDDVEIKSLDVVEKFKGKLLELSGICQRFQYNDGSTEVLLIGDRDFTVLKGVISEGQDEIEFEKIKLKQMIDSEYLSLFLNGKEESQWEGVACDPSGHVVLMDESPGALYVLNSDWSFKQIIRLRTQQGRPEGWDEENSRGEGLLMMKNGHIAILKEKKPSLIVEYGPNGDEPMGICRTTLLPKAEAFQFPEGQDVDFYPLFQWRFDETVEEAMEDFSEIAVGPDNRLYLLSQEGNRIARLEGKLRRYDVDYEGNPIPVEDQDEDQIKVKKYFELPGSIEFAEGLVILPGFVPLVASDLKELEKNVFTLTPVRSHYPEDEVENVGVGCNNLP